MCSQKLTPLLLLLLLAVVMVLAYLGARAHWQRTLRPQLRKLLISLARHVSLDVSEKPPPPKCKVCGERHLPGCYNIEEDEVLKKSMREMKQELMSLRR
eukprot:COSAG05_NODE_2194_length_3418_cov_6.232901_4_plen_99_part_00